MPRRVWTRTLGIVATLLVSGGGVAHAVAPALRPVSLPRDHGAHAGFSVEWWYTAGTVRGSNGHRYFWFATAWASPMGVVSRTNLLDLRTGETVFADENVAAAPLSNGQQVITAGTFRIARGADGRWRASDATAAGGGLALTLTPRKPYVLHGRRGIVRQGPAGRSAYYSEPRLGARGTLTLSGHRTTLTGLGWLDHQWGNFVASPGSLRWNWFACQLADGRDLMLYEFLNAQDRPSGVAAGTLVAAGGGRVTHLHRFTVTPLGPVVAPAGAHGRYPQRWRVHVPAAGLALGLRSLTRQGFIRNSVVPSFWEAPAAITSGALGGCIVESSREV